MSIDICQIQILSEDYQTYDQALEILGLCSNEDNEDLERVQKSAMRIILREDYQTYDQALEIL